MRLIKAEPCFSFSSSNTFNSLCLHDFYSQLQSTVNDSATLSDERKTVGTDSSELADTGGFAFGLKWYLHTHSADMLQRCLLVYALNLALAC